jgi:hypothetical protein
VAEAQYRAALAAHDTTGEVDKLRKTIADADAEISRYRETLFRLLQNAGPGEKAELYCRIGVRLTYRPGPETVTAEVVTPANFRV